MAGVQSSHTHIYSIMRIKLNLFRWKCQREEKECTELVPNENDSDGVIIARYQTQALQMVSSLLFSLVLRSFYVQIIWLRAFFSFGVRIWHWVWIIHALTHVSIDKHAKFLTHTLYIFINSILYVCLGASESSLCEFRNEKRKSNARKLRLSIY